MKKKMETTTMELYRGLGFRFDRTVEPGLGPMSHQSCSTLHVHHGLGAYVTITRKLLCFRWLLPVVLGGSEGLSK